MKTCETCKYHYTSSRYEANVYGFEHCISDEVKKRRAVRVHVPRWMRLGETLFGGVGHSIVTHVSYGCVYHEERQP